MSKRVDKRIRGSAWNSVWKPVRGFAREHKLTIVDRAWVRTHNRIRNRVWRRVGSPVAEGIRERLGGTT